MIDLFFFLYFFSYQAYSDKEKRQCKIKRHGQLLYNMGNWLKNSQQDTPQKNFVHLVYMYNVHEYCI